MRRFNPSSRTFDGITMPDIAVENGTICKTNIQGPNLGIAPDLYASFLAELAPPRTRHSFALFCFPVKMLPQPRLPPSPLRSVAPAASPP